MNFIQHQFSNMRYLFTKTPPKSEARTPAREYSKFDYYIYLVHKILNWTDISLTLIVFLLLNFAFWIVVAWELKPYTVLFLSLLVVFVIDHNMPTVVYIDNPDGLERFYSTSANLFTTLMDWRQSSHSSFTLTFASFFLILSLVGRYVSGHLFVYLVLLAVFFVPLALDKMPEEYREKYRAIMATFRSQQIAEDELIPYLSDNFNERDSEVDSLVTDRTADSLISGISTMPSYLDVVEQELQEEDLIPPVHESGVSLTPGDVSSDSDSEHRGAMRFESRHFNGDTSEEDVQIITSLLDAAKHRVGNIIRQVISSGVEDRGRSSGSESDFEIINPDETIEQ